MQDRRRLLLDRQPLQLDFGRKLGQRGLHAVVDVDRVDVGIAAEQKADGQGVAAVIAARRLHVDHLVDADDLRLDRLGDARFDDRGGSAGIGGGHLHLRRHDVGKLRDRNARQRQQAGDRDDDRDDDREPRAIDERSPRSLACFPACAEVGLAAPLAGLLGLRGPARRPAARNVGGTGGGGLAGPGDTASPGRTRCSPSLMTSSPSLSPLVTTAVDGVDWPSWMRRICALFCASTT